MLCESCSAFRGARVRGALANGMQQGALCMGRQRVQVTGRVQGRAQCAARVPQCIALLQRASSSACEQARARGARRRRAAAAWRAAVRGVGGAPAAARAECCGGRMLEGRAGAGRALCLLGWQSRRPRALTPKTCAPAVLRIQRQRAKEAGLAGRVSTGPPWQGRAAGSRHRRAGAPRGGRAGSVGRGRGRGGGRGACCRAGGFLLTAPARRRHRRRLCAGALAEPPPGG